MCDDKWQTCGCITKFESRDDIPFYPLPADAIKTWAIKTNWHEKTFFVQFSWRKKLSEKHKQVIMTKVLLSSRPYECMWLWNM